MSQKSQEDSCVERKNQLMSPLRKHGSLDPGASFLSSPSAQRKKDRWRPRTARNPGEYREVEVGGEESGFCLS